MRFPQIFSPSCFPSTILVFFRYGGPTAVNDASRLRLESFQQEEVQREIAEFRSTPAGQFCIRMFREHRLTKL